MCNNFTVCSGKGRKYFSTFGEAIRWAYVELALEECQLAIADVLNPFYVYNIRYRQARRWKRSGNRP